MNMNYISMRKRGLNCTKYRGCHCSQSLTINCRHIYECYTLIVIYFTTIELCSGNVMSFAIITNNTMPFINHTSREFFDNDLYTAFP